MMERAIEIFERVYGKDHESIAYQLNTLAAYYQRQHRLADAEAVYRRSLGILDKRYNSDGPMVAMVQSELARLLVERGHYPQAESLFRDALLIKEKASGTDQLEVAALLKNLADLHLAQGRNNDAEQEILRALSIYEMKFDQEHALMANAVQSLAVVYLQKGNIIEFLNLLDRVVSIRKKALGDTHILTVQTQNLISMIRAFIGGVAIPEKMAPLATAVANAVGEDQGPGTSLTARANALLASAFELQGRFSEARALVERTLAEQEKLVGPDDPGIVASLNELASLCEQMGEYPKAEALYRRALNLQEKATGEDRPDIASTLEKLAGVLQSQYRYGEAELLLRRALTVHINSSGENSIWTAVTQDNIASVYRQQRRYAEAEPLYKRSIAIKEKEFGVEHPFVAGSLRNLASAYLQQGRYAEAESLLLRALAIDEKAFGAEGSFVALDLNELGLIYDKIGQREAAEPLLVRSLAIREKLFGSAHPDTALSLNNLGWNYSLATNWALALEFYEKSISASTAGPEQELVFHGMEARERSSRGIFHIRYRFGNHVQAAYWTAKQKPDDANQLRARAFEVAQWASLTDAGLALSAMAARLGSDNAALVASVREYQDLGGQWRAADLQLIKILSTSPAQRRPDVEDALKHQMNSLYEQREKTYKMIGEQFPEYAALAFPRPLSLVATQRLLKSDEALIQFIFAENEGFAWAITATDMVWAQIPMSAVAVANEVGALRCGLDVSAHRKGYGPGEVAVPTAPLIEVVADHLPFDLLRAHKLYRTLFGPFTEILGGKRLLIAPSGALTALPFQVLVMEEPAVRTPPTWEGYRGAKWFGRVHAITVLPSVASLAALRGHAKQSQASEPFIGFGNPALNGKCGKEAGANGRDGDPRKDLQAYFRGAQANVEEVRGLCPLPDSAKELRSVAAKLGAAGNKVILGEEATETAIKALSQSGALARHRIVQFGTHGLIAGEIKGQAEPALVLTPPAVATDTDDGLLTASEVMQLRTRRRLGGVVCLQHGRRRETWRRAFVGTGAGVFLCWG